MDYSEAAGDMSETNISEASSAFSRFHLPPSHPQLISKIPKILPHERVFPIQIGSELFKLSGASLSSDGVYNIRFSISPPFPYVLSPSQS